MQINRASAGRPSSARKSSGCTAEAKSFTEKATQFKALKIPVIGVSPDSVASHKKFKNKYGLSLVLAADEDKTAAAAWGVWVEKSMYGRKYMGVERATFLIDRDALLRFHLIHDFTDRGLDALHEIVTLSQAQSSGGPTMAHGENEATREAITTALNEQPVAPS